MVRDDGTFLGKAFNVIGFLLQERKRNEEREIRVFVPRYLEQSIQSLLHVFPNCPAPWLYDHAAANIGVFGQISCADDLLIPFGIVFGARRSNCRLGHAVRFVQSECSSFGHSTEAASMRNIPPASLQLE